MSSIVELPDFELIFGLIDEIYDINKKLSTLSMAIKVGEANVTKKATANKDYFVNGKSPSQTYIDNMWKYSGLNDELIPLRKELADLENQLEYAKLKLSFYKDIMDIWRTQSANERSAIV